MPLGRLPRPVPDGGDDHLDAGKGVGVQGVEEGGEVVLDVAAVDDDAEVGDRPGERVGDRVGHRGDSFASAFARSLPEHSCGSVSIRS
ncbi:hypothetical protein STENM223S_03293 [Streptomyces tendae]